MRNLFLIGSGPGNSKFLTLESLNYIFLSKIIFYDSLINIDILNFSNIFSKKILIGKRFCQKSIYKKTIYIKLYIYYIKYFVISKLKSGDINLFSRINNEINFFYKNYIKYELVPGITSLIISLIKLKISLTFRFNISSILLITYYNNINISKLDKSFFEKTIVYYMINNNINYIIDFIKLEKSKINLLLLLENGSFFSQHIYILNIYDINFNFLFNILSNNCIKLLVFSNLLKTIKIFNFYIKLL